MENEKYFLVTVMLKVEQENGRLKKVPENYLVKGFTLTDVEKKINEEFANTTIEFSIKSLRDPKIIKVIE